MEVWGSEWRCTHKIKYVVLCSHNIKKWTSNCFYHSLICYVLSFVFHTNRIDFLKNVETAI